MFSYCHVIYGSSGRMKMKVGDPLKISPRVFNGLKMAKNEQNHDICWINSSYFKGLLNFLFSCCLLILNRNQRMVEGSLVTHPGAQKFKNDPNCPKSRYFCNSIFFVGA